MDSSALTVLRNALVDKWFWIAMLLGPLAWWGLWFYTARSVPGGLTWSVLLSGVLLYPIIEELAFRGFIQTWLLEKPIWTRPVTGIISRANVLTSVAFAALHLFNQPPIWAALIFFPSLVFGYLRERFNAVSPSIIVHAWYNLGFLWIFS